MAVPKRKQSKSKEINAERILNSKRRHIRLSGMRRSKITAQSLPQLRHVIKERQF
jgi:ribosomal protein L32